MACGISNHGSVHVSNSNALVGVKKSSKINWTPEKVIALGALSFLGLAFSFFYFGGHMSLMDAVLVSSVPTCVISSLVLFMNRHPNASGMSDRECYGVCS